jgi:hypothetical protein
MPFPRKFKHLIERDTTGLTAPEAVRIEFCACATETDSCGWQGWTLSALDPSPAETRRHEADTRQRCPRCDRPLFHIGPELKYYRSPEQETDLSNGTECVVPTFVEDPDAILAREYQGVELTTAQWPDERDHTHCEVCGDRIAVDAFENSWGYTYGKGAWLCRRCRDRITRAQERTPGKGGSC